MNPIIIKNCVSFDDKTNENRPFNGFLDVEFNRVQSQNHSDYKPLFTFTPVTSIVYAETSSLFE